MRSPGSQSVWLLLLLTLIHPDIHRLAAQSEGSTNHSVQVAMKNIMYHYSDPIAAHIFQLDGEMVPARTGSVISLDDKTSFTLNIVSAEVAIDCNSLARVLNENVFSGPDAPVKSVTIESKNNQLIIKGKFHQKGDLPFEATGTLSANSDGRIRFHSDHVKAGHLPVKGILDLLGVDLSRMINTNKVRGISVEKDDVLLDPQRLLPPPQIQAKVTAIRIQGNDIVQVFGSQLRPQTATSKQSSNYVSFRHGEMHFGKLTMRDADIVMIDADPRTPFDFYIDHYLDQVIAGYGKITPEFGLRFYTHDYGTLQKRPVRQANK